MVELLYPYKDSIVNLHSEKQSAFIKMIEKHGIEEALSLLDIIKGNQDLSYSVPVIFMWKTDDVHSVFELSEDIDFKQPRIIETTESFCIIENLKIGTQYFWRVNNSNSFSFTTTNSYPRFITIDGALNVRDIGGKLIKQGLVYRGSELNGAYSITEKGKETFCKELGIKTVLDLRKLWYGKLDKSPAGDDIHLKQIPYRPYEEVFEEEHRIEILEIIKFLSDEQNYPIYIHCKGGADRTGMISLYLKAIVGETEEDIHLDYELTSLATYGYEFNSKGYRSRNSGYYLRFLGMLDAYAPCQSLNAKILGFLYSCGITSEHIEKIRSILKNT